MAGITHEYSQFPDSLFERTNYKDVDDTIANIINQIKDLQAQGLYNQVQQIVEENAYVLKPYNINAETMNAYGEELRNLQIYAKQVQQAVYVQDDEPDSAKLNDVWIGD